MEFRKSSFSSWHWWVSALLLLATMLNYMDRQTLANLSVRIKTEFSLDSVEYGKIEMAFGLSFALGSLVFGTIADRVSIRLLYPLVLFCWSAVGFATGYSQGYLSMLSCRALLGFFEAGHWPCALIVTQRLLSSGDRVLGNSVLQSGASIGAIITPWVVLGLVGKNSEVGAWRLPFFVVGLFGLIWVALWLLTIPGKKLELAKEQRDQDRMQWSWLREFLLDPRFWALAAMVTAINTSWQIIRAWLQLFLVEEKGYQETTALYFNSVYFLATDVGCILAGMAGVWLLRFGFTPHRSRLVVFGCCALLTALTNVAAFLPAGWGLLTLLLVVAGASLGLFPCYYSFTQELSTQNMGKLTGLLSAIAWVVSSINQPIFGWLQKKLGSYEIGLCLVGWAPLIGFLFFLLMWRNPQLASEDDARTA